MNPRQLLEQAAALQARGRLAEAEQLCRQILAAAPEVFQARHLLAVILLRQDRAEEALAMIGKALQASLGAPPLLATEAMALQKLGRTDEALKSYDRALKAQPGNAAGWYNRGLLLKSLKRYGEAVASYDRALALQPDDPRTLNNRATALLNLERYDEALADLDTAFARQPGDPDILNNRGVVMLALDRPADALAAFDAALAVMPRQPETLHQRGRSLQTLERDADALASYAAALAIKPDHREARYSSAALLFTLGRDEEALAACDVLVTQHPDFANGHGLRSIVLQRLGRTIEAIQSIQAGIALAPDNIDMLVNRSVFLWSINYYEEALASIDVALAQAPRNADVLHNRGNILFSLRRFEDAAASYEAALATAPDHAHVLGSLAGAAMNLCDWERVAQLEPLLLAAVEKGQVVPPLTLIGYTDDPALLYRNARAATEMSLGALPPPLWTGKRYDHARIRVAYLSSDFRAHPVAYHIAPVIEHHDRARFECIGISLDEDDGSLVRARIAGMCDSFHTVSGFSDRQVADLLLGLEVDIAVDLNGHTVGGRAGIFQHRPAPTQVAFLGYAGTSGADFLDYILADALVAPSAQQPFYSERIVHLPRSFMPNAADEAISQTPSRADAGLPDRGFVFCCFNGHSKITAPYFDAWMRLLSAVPDSVLWLRDDAVTRDRLRDAAAARGVDPARLIFAPRADKIAGHLARHRLADLFLDTLPYNAHVTACDALWTGLPVLTCEGRSFASRVGASLLQAVELPELIAADLTDYEARALALATDPARLAGLRTQLMETRNTSGLFDPARLTRHIEAAYTVMRDAAAAGQPPQAFAVPA